MSGPQQFRKRPVVIEAMQWDGTDDTWAALDWCGARPVDVTKGRDDDGNKITETVQAIGTLEGDMVVTPGDWIIRGVQGEFYPCKPEIFEATYEAVSS
jgi:hypothetical protein